MKVMSWNIWGGKNLEGVKRYIQQIKPDVIGLQEIKTLNGQNHAEYLGQALGYYVSYCKSFTTDRHFPSYDLGNAILTNEKPSSSICHTLSSLGEYQGSSVTEPRTAVEVILPYQNSTISLISTHLGYSDKFGESEIRDLQTEKLLQIIENREKIILMGDFNSTPTSRVISKISSVLIHADPQRTQMSFTDFKDPTNTQYRIDYIFTSSDVQTKNFTIYPSEASDHLPLSIEI